MSTVNQPTPITAERAYRNVVLIAAALVIGQLVFAAVVWFVRPTAAHNETAALINPLTYAWMGMCGVSLITAFALRQKLGSESPTDRRAPAQAMMLVIILWALFETGSILGIMIFFLNGQTKDLLASLAYLLLCAAFFFPRRTWFSSPNP